MSGNLSVKQFAAVVGYSEKTIRRKLEGGKIPGAFRVGDKGSQWKIPREAEAKLKGDR